MHYAAIDLGATNLRAIVGDDSATVVGRARAETPNGSTGEDVAGSVVETLREACAAADVEPSSIAAAGVGAAGQLDRRRGAVRPVNVRGVESIPIVGPLTGLLGTDDVFLHKDTAAAAMGERFFTAPGVENLVYLTISSGIGAGVVVDGRVLAGRDGNVGEVGHVTVDPDGEMTCGCGRAGHWEAYCSGNNIPRYARVLAADGAETTLPLERPDFDARDVFARADSDPLAATVLDRVADWNAIGVATIVHAYAPATLRIGGAVALNNPDRVIGPIRERIDGALVVDSPEIEAAELGEDAVLEGALASAITGGTG